MADREREALCERITAYLAGGGLFNPELADHTAVRDLLIECRAALSAPQHSHEAWRPIESASADRIALLYAPPQALYVDHEGKPGEYRVAAPRNWTWATHWAPLPQQPDSGT
jgi:hypothetical protein